MTDISDPSDRGHAYDEPAAFIRMPIVAAAAA